jgi:hypothetical protein
MQRITRRIASGIVLAGALTGAFFAGAAYAADARLDLADTEVRKAIALVKSAENPLAKDPNRPFGQHQGRAVDLLERARKEIAAAKAFADNPKNQKGVTQAAPSKAKPK